MTFGSLFSGVGGFDLGLERAGMTPVWQVEKDEQAASVLRHHWPDVDLLEDVCDVGAAELSPVDLICGGFPCQDLSVAGRRAGLAGGRSGLFYEFMRIVDELAPRWVLVENVPGLLSSHGGRDMGAVLGTLGELGYGWTYRVLDTQYFGPPQRRRRVFIVGCAGGFCGPEVLLEPESLPWNPAPSREAREGAAGRPSPSLTSSGSGVARPGGQHAEPDFYVANAFDPYNQMVTGAKTGTLSGGEAGNRFPVAFNWQSGGDCRQNPSMDGTDALTSHQTPAILPFDTTQVTSKTNRSQPKPGDPCHPLAAGAHPPSVAYAIQERAESENPNAGPDGAGVSVDVAYTLEARTRPQSVTHAVPRRLTPIECERLQGWPDDWTRWGMTEDGEKIELADSPRYRMCGNGVSAPVAEWIGRRIMALDIESERTGDRGEVA